MRTALLLARKNTKRLPGKVLLPWQGTTLMGWAVRQTLMCPGVDTLWVGSDCAVQLRAAQEEGGLRVVTVLRPEVTDEQPNWVGRAQVLYADDGTALFRRDGRSNHVLQVQVTSPFINPADLQKLASLPDPAADVGIALSVDMQNPSGLGYLVNPAFAPSRWEFIKQDGDPCDVNTIQDYAYALSKMPQQPVYGSK